MPVVPGVSRSCERRWNPELRRALRVTGSADYLQVKGGRHYAHDRIRLFRQTNDLAEHRAAAEPALPERVAQDDDAAAARLVLLRRESSADRGRRAEHREEITRDAGAEHALRLVAHVQIETDVDHRRHRLEGRGAAKFAVVPQ